VLLGALLSGCLWLLPLPLARWARIASQVQKYDVPFEVGSGAQLLLATHKGAWYLVAWEDCLAGGQPKADVSYYVDRNDGRLVYRQPYARIKSTFVRRSILLYANSDAKYIRFLGSNAASFQVRNMSLTRIPKRLGYLRAYWCMPLVAALVLAAWRLRQPLRAYAEGALRYYHAAPNGLRWVLFLALTSGVYGLVSLTVVLPVFRNNPGGYSAAVTWHIAGVPAAILILHYLLGWPVASWALRGARRAQCEMLLALVVGMVLLLCAYTLSSSGIRSSVCCLLLASFAVVAWTARTAARARPAAPDAAAGIVLLLTLVVFWCGMHSVATQRDAWPSTLHNADLSVYIAETTALHAGSMRDIVAAALAYKEPSYLSYKADVIRGVYGNFMYFRATDAVEHVWAMLAWFLGCDVLQVVAVYANLLVPLLILACVAGVRLFVAARVQVWCLIVLGLASTFSLIYLQRDAYYNNMVALILLWVMVACALSSITTRAWRMAVIAGLCLGALLMIYMVAVPFALASLAIACGSKLFALLRARRYRHAGIAVALLLLVGAVAAMVAPQMVCWSLADVLHKRPIATAVFGRPAYPERAFSIAGGFIGDWMPVMQPLLIAGYDWLTWLLTVAIIAVVGAWYVRKPWKSVHDLLLGFLAVSALTLLWSYYRDPSHYVYFKILAIAAAFLCVAAVIALSTLVATAATRGLRVTLLLLGAAWLGLRVAGVPLALTVTAPVHFINERMTSLDEIAGVVPATAIIRVDATDYYYAPYLHTRLRNMKLCSDTPVGYGNSFYTNAFFTHILSAMPVTNATPMWSNGYFWLYPRP
ncbi:MAG: hypothetical protein NTV22_07455, partial [bacterium]|nr:hypothetical protein [bacterium]